MAETLTDRQKGILAMVELSEMKPPKKVVERTWTLLGWRVRYRRKSPDGLWGRFGGGWQWAIGAHMGRRTLLVYLLIATISVSRAHPKGEDEDG